MTTFNNYVTTGTATTNNLVFFLIVVVLFQLLHTVHGDLIITWKEEQCLEKTGTMFEGADKDLLIARHDFSTSMEMDMTSSQKMYAKYPEEKLKRYDEACTKYGGFLHTIKLDFFDCTLKGATKDVELTLENFANCMANVDECKDFTQEPLLEEAWNVLGLHCELEDEETKKDPPPSSDNKNKETPAYNGITKKEREAAAEGADNVDKEEKKLEYIPKEEQENSSSSSSSSKKKGFFGGFMKFVLFASVCGVGYFVFDRRRRGLPIQLPSWAGGASLPFFGGGGNTNQSRFSTPQIGVVSNYNLLSHEERNDYNLNNEVQLSSNLTA